MYHCQFTSMNYLFYPVVRVILGRLASSQEIQQELVELDDAFYGDGTENDHSFSVDFKLRVNPDLLRSDTKDVVVRLKLAIWLQGEPKYFNVTLPTNQDEDASKSSNWWPWLTFILVLLFFSDCHGICLPGATLHVPGLSATLEAGGRASEGRDRRLN